MLHFDSVSERLLVGTCPRESADIERLKQHDVGHVICLQSDADFTALGINWSQMKAGYEDNCIPVTRIAMVDFDEDNIAALLSSAADVVVRAMEGSGIVYLHCTAGRERSPTVAAAWMMREQGLSATEACRKVTTARPGNPYLFMLQHFERSL